MAKGFVKVGKTWVRSEEIYLIWGEERTSSMYDEEQEKIYRVNVSLRTDKTMNHTVAYVDLDADPIDHQIATAQRDLYIEDLLERIRICEGGGQRARLPIGEDPERNVEFVRAVLGEEIADQIEEILEVGT